MAQLTTPAGIGKTLPSNTTDKTVIVQWTKPSTDFPTGTTFKYQFVNKGNPSDIIVPSAAQITTPAKEAGGNYTVTFTLADNAAATELGSYIAEVMAIPKTGSTDTASDWGKERYWIVGPTLTIKIGSQEFTLTKDTFAGATTKIYKLPASDTNPITITYDNVKSFATSMGLTAPTKYPDGSTIAASLDIYQLVVDLGNNLFTLSISINVEPDNPLNKIIPHLSISKMGLVVKRTDGSI